MEGPGGSRVLLLKGERGCDPSGEEASDAYKDLLEREGFQVTIVPVLQFNYVNSSLVPSMLASPTASSIVLTSPRAVTALSRALQEESVDSVLASWKEKWVFCVGPATAKATQVLMSMQGTIVGSKTPILGVAWSVSFWRGLGQCSNPGGENSHSSQEGGEGDIFQGKPGQGYDE